jgi:hypothetical protein
MAAMEPRAIAGGLSADHQLPGVPNAKEVLLNKLIHNHSIAPPSHALVHDPALLQAHHSSKAWPNSEEAAVCCSALLSSAGRLPSAGSELGRPDGLWHVQ